MMPRHQLAIAQRLTLKAIDEETWQKLIDHREWIERELLRQVRVIQVDQQLPIFLPDKADPLFFKVCQIHEARSMPPKQRLDNNRSEASQEDPIRGYWLSLGTEIIFLPPADQETVEHANGTRTTSSGQHLRSAYLRVRVLPLETEISDSASVVVLHPVTLAALGVDAINAGNEEEAYPGYVHLEWNQKGTSVGKPCSLRASIVLNKKVAPRHVQTTQLPPGSWVNARYIADVPESRPCLDQPHQTVQAYRSRNVPVVYGEESGKATLKKVLEAIEPVFGRYQGAIPAYFSEIQGRVVLLGGASGTGKTHIATAAALECSRRHPLHPRPVYLACRSLFQSGAAQSYDAVRQLLQQLMDNVANRPTIIILDDLDALLADDLPVPAGSGSGFAGGRALGLPNIMDQIEAFLERATYLANIVVLITVTIERVGTATGPLPPPGIGFQVLDTRIEIPLPDSPAEKSAFVHRSWEKERFERYTPADLLKLDRFQRLMGETGEANASVYGPRSLLQRTEMMASSALMNDGVQLADIGGLEKAKKMLLDTLMLPLRFPVIFEQAPIRLPAGILVYGMPGTGKTVLVQAAVAHAGLRMIQIKGPELLNKYVGASEASVRSLFSRARQQRPCVVFFDEFESLAPRRGGTGDRSTGVTDRMVNALLTELDGVESLDTGIFVVAATCRPDLVDPALLRPGRIDRWVRLEPPELPSEREDILRRLTRDWRIVHEHTNEDLDAGEREHFYADIAARTRAFTAADLAALCSSAAMIAEQRHPQPGSMTPRPNRTDAVAETERLAVRCSDLMAALATHRLSLPLEERQQYIWAMARFEGTDAAQGKREDASSRVMLE
jgi:peroxin-1